MTTDTTTTQATTSPIERWRQEILERAVPQRIRDSVTDEPRALTPERFGWRPEAEAGQPAPPSRLRALDALPEGGTVMDVGVGGGRSSLGLGTKAGLIIGVDRLEPMLESFLASAAAAGINARAVRGGWPDVADEVETVDVAVSNNAVYGLADLEPFIRGLTDKARSRVVMQLSVHPPQSHLAPLWKAFHGIDRPVHYVADAAYDVISAMGLAVEREESTSSYIDREVTPEAVAFARRRLYVGPERDAEIADFLADRAPRDHRVVALWWPGAAA